MTFTGGVVAVGVGGTGVGVSVGGMGVAEGATVVVGGTEVGMLVTEMAVPDAAHPARASMLAHIIVSMDNFLNIYTSFYWAM
jgi:hypothetical protein